MTQINNNYIAKKALYQNHQEGVKNNSLPKNSKDKTQGIFNNIISGFDKKDIRKGKLTIEVPLQAGKHYFPLKEKDARINIKKDTSALLVLAIKKNSENELAVKNFSLHFSHKVKIKNPSASLENKKSKVSVSRKLKDGIANLKLKSINIDNRGQVSVDGSVKIFKLFKSKIMRRFDMNMPVIDEELFNQTTKFDKKNKTLDIKKMLESIGGMTRQAKYNLKLRGDNNHDRFISDYKIKGEGGKLKLDVGGRLDLNDAGEFILHVNKNESKFSFSLGELVPNLKAHIKNIGDDQKPLETHLRGKIRGRAKDIEVNLFSKKNITNVMPERMVKKAQKKQPLNSEDYTTSIGAKDVDVSSRFDIRAQAKDKRYKIDGHVSLKTKLHNPYAKSLERGIEIDGEVVTNFKSKRLIVRDKKGLKGTRANAQIGINPSKKTRQLYPEINPINFKYQAKFHNNNELTIKPPNYGLPRFLRPLMNMEGHKERINNLALKKTPCKINSEEYFHDIEQITGAKVKNANNVKLLTNGVNSMPERLRLINQAKDFICFQTLIFKSDESGWRYAEALVSAKKRGVRVYGIVDSLGNIESGKDLEKDNEVLTYLRKNGVSIHKYNANVENGLRKIFALTKKYPGYFLLHKPTDIKNMGLAIRFLEGVIFAADNNESILNSEERNQLKQGIHELLYGKKNVSPQNAVNELKEALSGNMTSLTQLLGLIKRVGKASYRWHEKYLIADGKRAILGGMNIADEYLLGGTGQKVNYQNEWQDAWRDTDILLNGEVVHDALNNFKRNYYEVADTPLNEEPSDFEEDNCLTKKCNSVLLQHRPRMDGDHNIVNFLIYNLRSLKPGERAWFETVYFLPRGILKVLKKEFIHAAKRGVDVRILTNSPSTSDFEGLVDAAVFDYRALLKAGVRVYHREKDGMVHAKTMVLGKELSMVGSWNLDNRSATHDSEDVVAVYDEDTTEELANELINDMMNKSKEVKISEIKARSINKEIKSAGMLLVSELL